MASSTQGTERPVILAAVRNLIGEARASRAALNLHDPDRDFYLGVEAAANEILHPELHRPVDGWLERESSGFRSGYLRASTALGVALTAGEPVVRFRLPQPDGGASG